MRNDKNHSLKVIKKEIFESLTYKNSNFSIDHLNILQEKFNDGTIIWNRNFSTSILNAIDKIDYLISLQLNEIIHHPCFLELEAAWRGIFYIIKNNKNYCSLKIKILPLTKDEIKDDFYKHIDIEQSNLFKKIYETEFDTPGGEPFSIMVADYHFSNNNDDIEILENFGKIGSAAFCPFLSAASPELFGFESWSSLQKPRDLKSLFANDDYIKWRALREQDISRFVTLTLPKILARPPYSPNTHHTQNFCHNEYIGYEQQDIANNPTTLPHEQCCWMNAAFALADKIIQSFNEFGWSTAIRGAESGGKVTDLPLYYFNKDQQYLCPTEITITDRREAELSELGFLPLCYYKRTNYAVFFGAQSIHLAAQYDEAEASANAIITARLPYILASSRFAHYIKIMAREKLGAFANPEDLEAWLNRWILNYVNGNPQSGPEMKAKYPLAEAKIKVQELSNSPGTFHAITWLKPWLQLEKLSTSIRMVAKIPYITSI